MQSTSQSSIRIIGSNLIVASPANIIEATFAIPAIRALREELPKWALAVVAKESVAPLWRNVTNLEHVISYPDGAKAKEIAELIQQSDLNFESSLAWEASEAANAFARLKIAQRIGYPARGLKRKLTTPITVVDNPGPIKHRVEHYLEIFNQLNIETRVPAYFQAPPLPTPIGAPKILLAPHSDLGPSHIWPVERLAEVANLYYKEKKVEFIIAGTTGSEKVAAQLASKLEVPFQNFAGSLDTKEILDIAKQSIALVGSDGTIPHISARYGVPSIVIFGPNEPAWKRPLGKMHRIVREHVACSPCFASECVMDRRCQLDIPVETVFQELRKATGLGD